MFATYQLKWYFPSLISEEVTEFVRSIIQVLKAYRANVLTPLLWIVLICTVATIYAPDLIVRYVFLGLGTISVIYSLLKYQYWSKEDPRRLQSEYHTEQMKRLDLIAQQGHAPILPADAEIVRQPPLLEEGEK